MGERVCLFFLTLSEGRNEEQKLSQELKYKFRCSKDKVHLTRQQFKQEKAEKQNFIMNGKKKKTSSTWLMQK